MYAHRVVIKNAIKTRNP